MLFKNRLFKITVITVICIVLTGLSISRDVPGGIAESFKKGNARELARHFNDNIELVVLNNEDVYSKSQAELILRDFFSANNPVDFKLLHQGGKETRFAICNLVTKNGDFRVYFLLKQKDGVHLIHLLRIEKVE
jgi:hypothetical protein